MITYGRPNIRVDPPHREYRHDVCEISSNGPSVIGDKGRPILPSDLIAREIA